jgi:hypothetical protein
MPIGSPPLVAFVQTPAKQKLHTLNRSHKKLKTVLVAAIDGLYIVKETGRKLIVFVRLFRETRVILDGVLAPGLGGQMPQRWHRSALPSGRHLAKSDK